MNSLCSSLQKTIVAHFLSVAIDRDMSLKNWSHSPAACKTSIRFCLSINIFAIVDTNMNAELVHSLLLEEKTDYEVTKDE